MKLHQILTGSCNINDQCISICSIDYNYFIAYGSGKDIVILNDKMVRYQILFGTDDYQIHSISSTMKTGYVLGNYKQKIIIFHPTTYTVNENKSYKWILNQVLTFDSIVNDSAWIPNNENFIFTVGEDIKVWKLNDESCWESIINRNSPDGKIVDTLKFSSDGKFCATCCYNSNDIFIWFWKNFNKEKTFLVSDYNHTILDYVKIKHPAKVVYFEWRMISNLMPRQIIKSMLLSCCEDNVCRIWSENQSPSQYLSSNQNGKVSFKNDVIELYKNSRITDHANTIFTLDYFPNFLLSASINDNSDIPFFINHLPGLKVKSPFIVHWMNNKSFVFDSLINELMKMNTLSEPNMIEEIFCRKFISEVLKWKNSTDVLFCIHPVTGNLLIWHVFNLDDSGNIFLDNGPNFGNLKSSQVNVHSCLPNSVPIADASSMNPTSLLFNLISDISEMFTKYDVETFKDFININIKMISKHDNGSLNMWNLSLANDNNGNSSILNMNHMYRISGHHWQTNKAACHTQLPLLLTISNFSEAEESLDKSELILWKIKSVGPFSKSGGISEIARINSKIRNNFVRITWFPDTIPSNLIDLDSNSPLGLFSASDSNNMISIYISLPEANQLLTDESWKNIECTDNSLFKLVSLSSTGEPGCIIFANLLEDSQTADNYVETIFMHIFPHDMIMDNYNNLMTDKDNKLTNKLYNQNFFAVRILKIVDQEKIQYLIEMWIISVNELTFDPKPMALRSLSDIIKININNKKIYSKPIPLKNNLDILQVTPAASHLSSASIYPEILAPYLFVTLLSDNSLRFWKCISNNDEKYDFSWIEWMMNSSNNNVSSRIQINYPTFKISCAYSGRVAVAHVESNMFFVEIYESESTGGNEWLLEDFITYDNSFDQEFQSQKDIINLSHLIHIDWINSEDGSHFLSISVGSNINIYVPTSLSISNRNNKQKDKIGKWMKVKEFNLKTISNKPCIAHISWTREGLMVIGIDNEIHVYNQWNSNFSSLSSNFQKSDQNDIKHSICEKIVPSFSFARLEEAFKSNIQLDKGVSKMTQNQKSDQNVDKHFILNNSGLFEISQLYNSILPQYHPKKLLEWINFGKINRVKAILSHLTDCIHGQSFQIDKSGFNSNQLEIKAIPSLPLYILLELDKEKIIVSSESGILEDDTDKDVVFETDFIQEEQSIKEFEEETKSKLDFYNYFNLMDFNFTFAKAQKLSQSLLKLQLPGITTLDQIYLLGIAEIICDIKMNSEIKKDSVSTSENAGKEKKMQSANALDECGIKFLFAIQHFSFMTKTLPINQRSSLLNEGLDMSSIIWGFHSETEEELCTRLDEITLNNLTWSDFKRYGCGWWIRNENLLQRMVEKIAKNTFQKTKDPMDVAIYYLAMGKQNVLAKLFKSCNKDSLGAFFSLNFAAEENRKRALNQAFKLRSKRKFDHAAALCLLSQSVQDCLLIILHNLKDIQLVLTIIRIYYNSRSNSFSGENILDSVIDEHIIKNNDPFIRSMGHWMKNDFTNSLDTLIEEKFDNASNSGYTQTIVFIFYNYLKKHPIVKRHKNSNLKMNSSDDDNPNLISPKERQLFFRTTYKYIKMGCPDLALEVLSTLPDKIEDEKKNETVNEDIFSFSNDLDMEDISVPKFEMSWNDDSPPKVKGNFNNNIGDIKVSGTLDIMCLQYKFMICLKLISEELSTLATGIESSGSYLRSFFYNWLEKEFDVLHNFCKSNTNRDRVKGNTAKLLSLEHSRKNWLINNQSLILSLYSYCCTSSPNNVGLGAIKIELMILLQELQCNHEIKYISPINSDLPLIKSAFYCDNGIITTPLQQIKENISEMIDIFNSFQCPFLFLGTHTRNCNHSLDNYDIELSKMQFVISLCETISASIFQCLSVLNDNEKEDGDCRRSRTRSNSTSVMYTPEADIQARSKLSIGKNSRKFLPTSDPSKWPGFSLHPLLKLKGKHMQFQYSHFLAETLVVVYLGIILHSFKINDSNILYRLVNIEFNKSFWNTIFGGTFKKKPLRPDPPEKISSPATERSSNSYISNSDSPKKKTPPAKPQPPAISDIYIPPVQSILSFLLEKPLSNANDIIYDSDAEDTNDIDPMNYDSYEESFDYECKTQNSFTWSLIKLSVLNSANSNINNLIKLLQIESQELALYCPNILSAVKFVAQLETLIKNHLFSIKLVPLAYQNIIGNLDNDTVDLKNISNEGKLTDICKKLCDIPFRDIDFNSFSVKRLWINLVSKTSCQSIILQHFIHLIEIYNTLNSEIKKSDTTEETKGIKIVHKEHEVIISLAVNPINASLLATSTSKEIIELDIDNLINPHKWKEDDFEFISDLINESPKKLKTDMNLGNDFLLITPTYGLYNVFDKSSAADATKVVLKRPVNGVQILKSHPKMPYYLSGNLNGHVSVYEWGVENPVVKTYSPIQKGKITALNFDNYGNKFGMGDSEGLLSLCHFSYADNSRTQYFQTHCPHKSVLDLCFLNSSSVVASCGGSAVSGISQVNHLHAVGGGLSTFDNNSVNIVVWDILLPNGKNQIKKFTDSQITVGVVCLCYSTRYEQLIFGTRKGEIGLIDLRTNNIVYLIQGHEGNITSIKLDSLQDFFITSSVDGFIKIWQLNTFEQISYFKNEQTKTSVFRQPDFGIRDLQLLNNDKILSCSGDGLIRLRYLDLLKLFNKNNSDLL